MKLTNEEAYKALEHLSYKSTITNNNYAVLSLIVNDCEKNKKGYGNVLSLQVKGSEDR